MFALCQNAVQELIRRIGLPLKVGRNQYRFPRSAINYSLDRSEPVADGPKRLRKDIPSPRLLFCVISVSTPLAIPTS